MDWQQGSLLSPGSENTEKDLQIKLAADDSEKDEGKGKLLFETEEKQDVVNVVRAEHVLVVDSQPEAVDGHASVSDTQLEEKEMLLSKPEDESQDDNEAKVDISPSEVDDQRKDEEKRSDTDGHLEEEEKQENEPETEVERSESISKDCFSKESEGEHDIEESEEEQAEMEELRVPVNWNSKPQLLAIASQEYERVKNNYLRGCKWSPDGSCLLTNSRDNILRLYNLPAPPNEEDKTPVEMSPVLRMQEPDLIYDYCWYPLMSSNDPVSSCLLSTSRRHAIHLYDAYTGAIRCHYKPINHLDELESAMSVAFNHDGSKIYTGFTNGVIRVFDLNRPGDKSERRPRLGQRRIQGGIISCIATAPQSHLYAAGSYNRSVALYAEPGSMVAKLRGQGGGVTQLAFSPDARYLISGGRKDPEILVWDLRRPGTILYTMLRNVGTNQRMNFDLNESGQQLLTGNHSGLVSAFDLSSHQSSELQPVCEWTAHRDTCNGVSMNEQASLLATTSGQWNVPLPRLLTEASSDSSEEDEPVAKIPRVEENCLKVWHFT